MSVPELDIGLLCYSFVQLYFIVRAAYNSRCSAGVGHNRGCFPAVKQPGRDVEYLESS